MFNIWLTVLFSYTSSTSISINPWAFILPESTLSSFFTLTNLLSPVNAELSSSAAPLITFPSSGIFSPAFTTIISPIFTSSGKTFFTSSFIFILAYSGLISIKLEIDFLVLLTALASNIFPISYKVITITPSIPFPTKYAPIDDTTIKVFSSKTLFFVTCLNPFTAVLESNIINETTVQILHTKSPKLPYIPIKNITSPKINLIISNPFLWVSSFFFPSSKTSTSGSKLVTILTISSFTPSFLSVLNDNFNVEKLTLTSS